jgi:large subunit ribosomal protein L21
MYAVIRTGGKQYRVQAGDVLEVEHLAVKGEEVTFKPLLVSTDDGRTVHGAEAAGFPVAAKLLGDAKGDKVTVFKYRNKTGYAAKSGHRQLYSLIEITSIGGAGAEAPPTSQSEPAAPAPAKEKEEPAPAETPAAAEEAPAAEAAAPTEEPAPES